jgi:hypothetical protein
MITTDQVRAFLGIRPADTYDDGALASATDAANDMVQTWRPDLVGVDPWPGRAIQAALLLAGRLYGRRNSVEGLAGYADMGAVPISRTDPDVMVLLELGPNQPSVVA